MCNHLSERARIKYGKRRERERERVAFHKIIITDRRDMPCRADCLPSAGKRGVSEGVHSADDYIIYR